MTEIALASKIINPDQKAKIQFGALPWRRDERGDVEILVISSRETRRWVIPKGWPIKGLAPNMTAMREAYEEAGIEGYPSMNPIGSFAYDKRRKSGRDAAVIVDVYSLQVTTEHEVWPEVLEREKRWLPIAEAAQTVGEPELQAIIAGFAPL